MNLKTLSFGEILWDIFPDYKKPGGSPANLAYHLHQLGTDSLLLSRVGKDNDGDELLDFLKNKGVDCKMVQKDPSEPTGLVNVEFDDGEPSYTIAQQSAWDFIELNDNIIGHVKTLDAICFASLSQRSIKSRRTIQELLSLAPERCLKIFDLNLRPPFFDKDLIFTSIDKANIIKVNEIEFKKISEWIGSLSVTDYIFNMDPSKIILLTKGENGSSLITSQQTIHEEAHKISGDGDFVGIGDAFLACFTFLTLNHTPNHQILTLANEYAAFVASQKGGMPEIPASLIQKMQQ